MAVHISDWQQLCGMCCICMHEDLMSLGFQTGDLPEIVLAASQHLQINHSNANDPSLPCCQQHRWLWQWMIISRALSQVPLGLALMGLSIAVRRPLKQAVQAAMHYQNPSAGACRSINFHGSWGVMGMHEVMKLIGLSGPRSGMLAVNARLHERRSLQPW